MPDERIWRRSPTSYCAHLGICGVRLGPAAVPDPDAPKCKRCEHALSWQERLDARWRRREEHHLSSTANFRGRTGWPDIRHYIVWIYVLIDPRSMAVRYVGRTDDLRNRWSTHSSRWASKRVRKWFAEVRAEGREPIMVPVWSVDPGEDSYAAECAWYEHFYRRIGRGEARLLNAYRP